MTMEYKKSKPISDLVIPKGANQKEDIKIDAVELKKAAAVLRALNHRLRQDIMKLIENNKNIIVTELYRKLKIEQAVASQHLAILRNARVVVATREGKFIHYSINKDYLANVQKLIKGFLE